MAQLCTVMIRVKALLCPAFSEANCSAAHTTFVPVVSACAVRV